MAAPETKLTTALGAAAAGALGVVAGPAMILLAGAMGGAVLARQASGPSDKWWAAPWRFFQDTIAGVVFGALLAEWGAPQLSMHESQLWLVTSAVCAMGWRAAVSMLPAIVKGWIGRGAA